MEPFSRERSKHSALRMEQPRWKRGPAKRFGDQELSPQQRTGQNIPQVHRSSYRIYQAQLRRHVKEVIPICESIF